MLRLDHQHPHLARITVVDWTLGNACNHACSYCPPRLHDGSIPWPPLDQLTPFIDRLAAHYQHLDRTPFFQFTGGEPTVYPHFLPLLRHLRDRGCRAGVISNASRTLRWWDDAAFLLDQAVLTHHVEFVDLPHFINVARRLAGSIRTHVNVTMHPDRFDACLAAAAQIARQCDDITLTLKPLLIGFGETTYPYTPTQRQALADTRFDVRRTRPINEIRGPMRVTHADGSTTLEKPAHLILHDRHHFEGWHCHAGLELLAISPTGQIHRALCRQDGPLGHITDPHLALPTAPVTCTRQTCHCATDLMTTRHRA